MRKSTLKIGIGTVRWWYMGSPIFLGLFQVITPWNPNHPFRKENDLNQTLRESCSSHWSSGVYGKPRQKSPNFQVGRGMYTSYWCRSHGGGDEFFVTALPKTNILLMVDGSEIRRSPVDMVHISLFSLQGFYTSQVLVWDFGTINSSTLK